MQTNTWLFINTSWIMFCGRGEKKKVKACVWKEKSTALHQNLIPAVMAEGACFATSEHRHLAINSKLDQEQETVRAAVRDLKLRRQ